MSTKRVTSRVRWLLVLSVCVVPVVFALWTTFAASRTWTGASINLPPPNPQNNLWTNNLNWSGNVAPVAGDDLTFGPSQQATSLNNFANATTFNTITIGSGHTIQGSGVSLNAGLSATNANILLSSIKLNLRQSFTATVAT